MSDSQTLNADRGKTGSRVATALFDTRDAAEKAQADLLAAGMKPDTIVMAGNKEDPTRAPVLPEEGGFWHALKEFFIPDEDRYTFAEGLRRGGFLLSVKTDEVDYDRALDILDADGAVDIDERERTWQTEGWTGFPTGTNPTAFSVSPSGDASTAGFGASYAGEDGYQAIQPKSPSIVSENDESLTAKGGADAESRADAARVGTGRGESGLLNPDMRERIGSGTASMTPPTPTGPQDGAYKTNAASFDRALPDKAAIEDASLGNPTRSGSEAPAVSSTVGSPNESDEERWAPRRDTTVQRPRVRGFIVDPRNVPTNS